MLKRWAGYLLDQEIWLVVIAAVPVILLERGYLISLVVSAIFWPLRKWLRGYWSLPSPASWGIAGLVVMLAVSTIVSVWPQRTLAAVQPVLVGILLFFAFLNWIDRQSRLRLVLVGVILTGTGLAILTLAGSSRVMGLLGFPTGLSVAHQNVLAGAVALLAPLPLAWLFDRQMGWAGRIGLLAAFICMAVSIAVTASRGAYLAVAAGLIVLVVLRLPALGGLLIVLGGGAYWKWGSTILDWLTYRVDIGGGSWSGRMEIWLRAVLMLRDFPLTGIGMGNFPDVVNLLYPLSMEPGAFMPHAHQLFLQIAVDLGIPGLLAWLAVWIPLLVVGLKAYQKGGELRAILAGLIATQAVLLVHGLFDAVTWGTRPAVFVWVVWGLLAAASRLTKKTSSPDSR